MCSFYEIFVIIFYADDLILLLILIGCFCRQLPWLQLDEDNLWVSYLNTIRCYPRHKGCISHKGHISHKGRVSVESEKHTKVLQGHRVDVRRFVCKSGLVVSGAW